MYQVVLTGIEALLYLCELGLYVFFSGAAIFLVEDWRGGDGCVGVGGAEEVVVEGEGGWRCI